MTTPDVLDGFDKKSAKEVSGSYLVHRMGLFGNANLLDHIPVVEGFFPLMLAREQEIYARLFDANGYPRNKWADFLGVTETMPPIRLPEWRARPSAHSLITSGQAPIFLEDKGTLDLIASDKFDPGRGILLPPQAQSSFSGKAVVSARISDEQFSPHRISFITGSANPSIVVIAQSYYHYWRAEIDGHLVPVWRANYNYQSLQVPAGRHSVELVYRDRGFQIGALISLLALLMYGGTWYWMRRDKDRSTTTVAA